MLLLVLLLLVYLGLVIVINWDIVIINIVSAISWGTKNRSSTIATIDIIPAEKSGFKATPAVLLLKPSNMDILAIYLSLVFLVYRSKFLALDRLIKHFLPIKPSDLLITLPSFFKIFLCN